MASYSQFGPCCCAPIEKPGFMDFYQSTNVIGRMSSYNYFSRMCAGNTAQLAQNGRQVEPLWRAARPKTLQQRFISQSRACLPGGTVFQIEGYQPSFIDADISSTLNLTTRSDKYPLLDPAGDGWKVHTGALPEYRASVDIFKSNATAEIHFLFEQEAPTDIGIILRASSDASSFLRVRATGFTSNPLVLETVSGGAVSTIASTPLARSNWALSGLPIGLSATISGNQLHGAFLAGNVVVAAVAATVPNGSSTRFGMSLRSPGVVSLPFVQFKTLDQASYISAYSTGPSLGGSLDANAETGYSGPLIVGASVAFQMADAPTQTQTGPSDSAYAHIQVPYNANFPAGIGFGDPRSIPHLDPPVQNQYGGFFWGGREISASGGATSKAWLRAKTVTWHPVSLPPQQTPYNITLNELGKETVGAISSYGYPKACGVVLDSVSGTSTITSDGFGPYSAVWIVTGHLRCIAGGLSYGGTFAPTVNDEMTLASWTVQDLVYFVRDPNTGVLPPLDENDMRLIILGRHPSLNGGSLYFGGSPGRSPRLWDCDPTMGVWVFGGGWKKVSIKSDALDILGDGQYRFNHTNYEPRQVDGTVPDSTSVTGELPTGVLVNSWVIGIGKLYLGAGDSTPGGTGVGINRIQGGLDFLTYGHGLIGASAFNASDRFFYCSLSFDTSDHGYAFSTADLTVPKNQVPNPVLGYPGPPDLSHGMWAISYDGSIRYPLLAVDTNGNYWQRNTLEGNNPLAPPSGILSPGGFGVDCIKLSDNLAPPLKNPTF
jgi:hypothetical protein